MLESTLNNFSKVSMDQNHTNNNFSKVSMYLKHMNTKQSCNSFPKESRFRSSSLESESDLCKQSSIGSVSDMCSSDDVYMSKNYDYDQTYYTFSVDHKVIPEPSLKLVPLFRCEDNKSGYKPPSKIDLDYTVSDIIKFCNECLDSSKDESIIVKILYNKEGFLYSRTYYYSVVTDNKNEYHYVINNKVKIEKSKYIDRHLKLDLVIDRRFLVNDNSKVEKMFNYNFNKFKNFVEYNIDKFNNNLNKFTEYYNDVLKNIKELESTSINVKQNYNLKSLTSSVPLDKYAFMTDVFKYNPLVINIQRFSHSKGVTDYTDKLFIPTIYKERIIYEDSITINSCFKDNLVDKLNKQSLILKKLKSNNDYMYIDSIGSGNNILLFNLIKYM